MVCAKIREEIEIDIDGKSIGKRHEERERNTGGKKGRLRGVKTG